MLPSDLGQLLKDHQRRLDSFSRVTRKELVERHQREKKNPWMETNQLEFGQDIINVLRRCRGSMSSKPEDQVFAVQGMTDLSYQAGDAGDTGRGALVVSYEKSMASILTELTRHITQRDTSLGMLYLETEYGSADGIPSWVSNLACAKERWSWFPWAVPHMRITYDEASRIGSRNGLGALMRPQPVVGAPPRHPSARLPLNGCVIGSIVSEQCGTRTILHRSKLSPLAAYMSAGHPTTNSRQICCGGN